MFIKTISADIWIIVKKLMLRRYNPSWKENWNRRILIGKTIIILANKLITIAQYLAVIILKAEVVESIVSKKPSFKSDLMSECGIAIIVKITEEKHISKAILWFIRDDGIVIEKTI